MFNDLFNKHNDIHNPDNRKRLHPYLDKSNLIKKNVCQTDVN